jgi:hypothetical protein
MSFAIGRVYPVIVALYLVLFLSGCATTTTAKLTPEVPAMHCRPLGGVQPKHVQIQLSL